MSLEAQRVPRAFGKPRLVRWGSPPTLSVVALGLLLLVTSWGLPGEAWLGQFVGH